MASVVSRASRRSRVTQAVSQGPPRTIITSVSRRSRPRRAPPPSMVSFTTARSRRSRPGRGAKSKPSAAPAAGSIANNAFGAMVHSPLHAVSYWDAISHKIPPNISTTYGNFTCVNSLARFTYTMQANAFTQFVLVNGPRAMRVLRWASATMEPATAVANFHGWQQQQLNSTNTVPLDIRPLRLSMRFRNTTQNLNIAGSVTTVQVPQSIVTAFSSANTMTGASVVSMWNLCQASPFSSSFNGKELTKAHTLVTPPSSFMKYNEYREWQTLTANSDGGAGLGVADFTKLFFDMDGITPIYPATATEGIIGTMPSNYITLLNFQPNALAQTYEFEVFAQDGVRYPANSMAASVSHRTVAGVGANLTEGHVQALASAAAQHFIQPSDSVSQIGSQVSDMINAAAVGSMLPQAFGAVRNAVGSMGRMGARLGGEASVVGAEALRFARVARYAL